MSWLYSILKPILFLCDAEKVHRLIFALLKISRPLVQISMPLLPPLKVSDRFAFPSFRSPLGLAAGFDKDAELLRVLPHLGFGFVEVGTVTPLAQPGNSKPRLFRDPARSALRNRMGFNGVGAMEVARRLEDARSSLPDGFGVGVNLGKNKQTSAQDAWKDYQKACRPFVGLADYLVVNVSSPNTPGLRSLQTVEDLKPIIDGVASEVAQWRKKVPILLKLAPELQGQTLEQIIVESQKMGVSGYVLTNTLAGDENQPGGWSGGPVAEASLRSLKQVRPLTRLPIISVGGILRPEDAIERMDLGADLVQIYTGWIYGGPALPFQIHQALKSRTPS